MLVSVIISAYNGGKYISKCIDSFLNQSYSNIEIILFNDASIDNTLELMKQYENEYPEKIKVFSSKENQGPGGGKNEGMKQAKGEYIFFCDCDDYVDEFFIEELVVTAKYNNKPDIVIAGFRQVDENGNILYSRTYKDEEEALYQSVADWGKLIKLDFIRKNNLNIPYGKVLEDVLFRAVTICYNPKIVLSKCQGYNYVKNMSSVSHTYMKHFIPGVLDIEMNYLYENKSNIYTNMQELYCYWVFKVFCWHLLKSGSGVGREAMLSEYQLAVKYLEEYFPNYKKNLYLCKKQPKGERNIVKMAIKVVFIAHKLHLSKILFLLYSSFNFERLWPRL